MRKSSRHFWCRCSIYIEYKSQNFSIVPFIRTCCYSLFCWAFPSFLPLCLPIQHVLVLCKKREKDENEIILEKNEREEARINWNPEKVSFFTSQLCIICSERNNDVDFSTSFLWPCAICHICFHTFELLYTNILKMCSTQSSAQRKCVNNKLTNKLSLLLQHILEGEILIIISPWSLAWLSYTAMRTMNFSVYWGISPFYVCVIRTKLLAHSILRDWILYAHTLVDVSKIPMGARVNIYRRQLLYFVQAPRLTLFFFFPPTKLCFLPLITRTIFTQRGAWTQI